MTTLKTTIESSLKFAGEREGSEVRLWIVGRSAATTRRICTTETTGEQKKAKKDRIAAVTRFVEREKPRFLAATELALAEPMPNRSPLAEALTVVSWAEVHTTHRIVIFITDGREESGVATVECHPLPSEDSWLRRISQHQLLAPKSLDGVEVHFAFTTLSDIVGRPHCPPWTIAKETALRALWKTTVERAGGTLYFTTGPAYLTEAKGGLSR